MSDYDTMLTGKVINYVENTGASYGVKALVQAGPRILDVNFEFLQYEFARQEYPVGTRVDVEYYDGEWHIMGAREKPAGMAIFKAIESIGRTASYVKKGLTGPSAWERSQHVDTEGDLDFIKISASTADPYIAEGPGKTFKGLKPTTKNSVKCN